MIKTVLFFVPAPFGRRDYVRYGMEDFQRNGFDVYVWDFTPFLYPKAEAGVRLTDPIEWDHVVRFRSEADVVEALEQAPRNTFIFTSVAYSPETLGIFRAITRRRIPYCVPVVNAGPPLQVNAVTSMVKRILRVTPKRLLSFTLRHLPMRVLRLAPARFVLAEAALCSIERPEVAESTEVIRAHALDYNIFLAQATEPTQSNGTAVFLDNYIAFHPDALYADVVLPVTPDKYYPALRRFFDLLEQRTGLRVVIAAHPRSKYEGMPGVFGDREVLRGKTAQLVKSSDLVIVTFSTSITFAVLHKKPLMFVTTGELDASMYRSYIASQAARFGTVPLNIDRDPNVDLSRLFRVNTAAYDGYRNDYIKVDGSENLPTWQIVCNRIKSL